MHGPAQRAQAWRPTLPGVGRATTAPGGGVRKVTSKRCPILGHPPERARFPPGSSGSGRGLDWGRGCPGAGRGWPGKTEALSLRVSVEPGFRSFTFFGAGFLNTAGGKTRRPEAFAFFDAGARDAAAVDPAPSRERPQTEPSESLCPPPRRVPKLRSFSPLSSWPWSVRTSAQASASLRTQPSSPTAPRRPGAAAVSASPCGPATHPRPRLRGACRLEAAGGGRADSGRGEGKPGSAAGEGAR